ncbi:amino acid ABC transporter substrate-binding protein, PAAT family [Ruegeria intermedia]|uniref:Amino acid ABC transporter substrate-binding protein, PAAT family n=1 Tax=Ruegeria intermedia TaxID=996115 RepID=A0A1M4W283_9RHOB|nr:transporter substrate-binding domain-containing protein [Ruegeria intermedia]SHE75371.1 amino acid ABC transporter substrate-binding protein, PAAT family [Ruegeria intermedia]
MFEINLKKLVVAATAITALSAGAAAAQEACSNYTVQDGDTLATISIAAYGTSNYQPIFNANRNIISNPSNLEPGLVLALPCEDGSLPNGLSAQDLIAAAEARNANNKASNVYEPPVKILAGGNYAPFSDEGLSGGGLLVRLASTALSRGGNNREHSVSFVNDWGSHLDTLLPLGAFDVGLGWYIPDCSNRSYEWSAETTRRCNDFDSTVSVYDVVIGFYTLPDSKYAEARSFEDFKGARLCRMDAWFTHDLEEQGVFEPNITMVRPISAAECLDAVLTGTADVASFEVQLAADAMSEMGLTPKDIVENPFVNTIASQRIIAHRSNPFGKQYIAMLNKGLNEMRESGEWYDIVSDTLREHNEKMNAASN